MELGVKPSDGWGASPPKRRGWWRLREKARREALKKDADSEAAAQERKKQELLSKSLALLRPLVFSPLGSSARAKGGTDDGNSGAYGSVTALEESSRKADALTDQQPLTSPGSRLSSPRKLVKAALHRFSSTGSSGGGGKDTQHALSTSGGHVVGGATQVHWPRVPRVLAATRMMARRAKARRVPPRPRTTWPLPSRPLRNRPLRRRRAFLRGRLSRGKRTLMPRRPLCSTYIRVRGARRSRLASVRRQTCVAGARRRFVWLALASWRRPRSARARLVAWWRLRQAGRSRRAAWRPRRLGTSRRDRRYSEVVRGLVSVSPRVKHT